MFFNKYHTVEDLNDSTNDWLVRVRAQAVWKGITRETNEFRGYNLIFIDDCNARINDFIAPQISAKYEGYLKEGQIYNLSYFSVNKNDNRYLIDVVGVLDSVPRKNMYKKNDVEKSNVKFTLFDERCYANQVQRSHNGMMKYEEDKGIPCLTVKEFFNLKEDYIEKKVQCKVTVKKIEKKVNWYTNYCAKCDIDIELVNKKYQCGQCGKIYPYPDKRYQLTTLCSDSSGTIPIIWNDEEVIRLCGKTDYDLIANDEEVEDGEKFPAVLKEFEKKDYNITITITNENVKEGSRVYNAAKISDPNEISGNHSPNDKNNIEVKPTEIFMVSLYICAIFNN
ncbi:hypothetical protein POM88_031341 [Heracleum sosnowskyi]|uniref:Replication factor A C-terminal domain-containing protein n=1 Tax=Heracleum sosnowskyi TaxID=360622 RepID=A0AAD8HZB4_9APIA|nr:hypothetical protein POM88_031341 [Heracleum sosnowskyi]